MPVLYIVACGGRPGSDLPLFIEFCQSRSWDVCVIASPSGRKFIDAASLQKLTGHVVRYDYKQPDDPDSLPPPDAFIIAPATFNTVNKWAAGISDTLALGLLNESIGLGLPSICVPWPNQALAKHPAFSLSVSQLKEWGVRFIFDPDIHPLPVPNMGPDGNRLFPWDALRAELTSLKLGEPL